MRGPGLDSLIQILFSDLFATIKRGRQFEKIVPNLSYSNNLVKLRVVLGVIRHAESKFSLYFVLSLFLKEVLVIPCCNPCQLFQVSKTHHFFG